MNMQYLSLLIFVFAQTSYINHYKTAASPILYPRSTVADQQRNGNASSRNYYDGYPQKEELKKNLPYLLNNLRGSHALSAINLALWNTHYEDEEKACEAVDVYLKERSRDESSSNRICEASYRCDFDKYRFPSTIIAVDCDDGYCETTEEDDWQVRGSCLGDQYYLYTMKFFPDPLPPPVVVEQVSAEVETVSDGASGEGGLGIGRDEDESKEIKGKWAIQSSIRKKGCLCLAK